MRKVCFFAFVLLAAGLLSAAQFQLPPLQNVTHDFDKGANFNSYKTYKWINIANSDQLDELAGAQLVGTLQVELAKRGLTKTGGDNADLYIGYQITDGNQKSLASEQIGGSYSSADGASAPPAAAVHTGVLTLLMYGGPKKQLVWRGTVSNAINAEGTPEKTQAHMSRGIAKLLRNYPPQKKH